MTCDELLVGLGAKWDKNTRGWYEPTDAPDGLPAPICGSTLRAAALLASGTAAAEQLVMAVWQVDLDGGDAIYAVSRLGAVSADPDDYATVRAAGPVPGRTYRERAEERHARREAEAVAEMLSPTPVVSEVRRLLLAALADRGVVLSGQWKCADHLWTLIRSRRNYESAMARLPHRREVLRADYDRLAGELRSYGIA